jgi:uncharacterized protein (AIM24 family)
MSDQMAAEPGTVHSLADFVAAHSQENSEGMWQLEAGDRCLEIHLSGNTVFTKVGAMVARYGDIKFEHAGSGGAGKFLKQAMTGEQVRMMRCTGAGILYCADQNKSVSILHLNNEVLYVNANDCLAYSEGIGWDVVITKGAGVAPGGLFSLKLWGSGFVAITTHGRPLVLGVSPQAPLFTDPNATVAWSDGMQTSIHTDVSWKTFIGRASGESWQMRYDGSGFVVVQPYEEVAPTTNG